jgi:hypothetical protein
MSSGHEQAMSAMMKAKEILQSVFVFLHRRSGGAA